MLVSFFIQNWTNQMCFCNKHAFCEGVNVIPMRVGYIGYGIHGKGNCCQQPVSGKFKKNKKKLNTLSYQIGLFHFRICSHFTKLNRIEFVLLSHKGEMVFQ